MSRDQTLLNPLVQILARQLVEKCAEEGIRIKITDCYRTREEQNGLSANVTQVKYPYSFHNWGVAFDVCQNTIGNAYPTSQTWWNRVGKIGESLGLEWGGSWKGFVDRPHFQLNCYGTCEQMLKKYKSPDLFRLATDWKVVVPKLPITPSSQFRKIVWLQAMLCVHGYRVDIDGIWGKQTTDAVKQFWKDRNKTVVGKTCSTNMIKKLSEI